MWLARQGLSLYKRFVHFEAFMHESIILVLPCPTYIAHNSAILLHDHNDHLSRMPYTIHYWQWQYRVKTKQERGKLGMREIRIFFDLDLSLHVSRGAAHYAYEQITHTRIYKHTHTHTYVYMFVTGGLARFAASLGGCAVGRGTRCLTLAFTRYCRCQYCMVSDLCKG